MKSFHKATLISSLLLLLPLLASCLKEKQSADLAAPPPESSTKLVEQNLAATNAQQQVALPVRYQAPSYVVDKKPEKDPTIAEEARMKVEARISSTKGPQPLWDIMKRLAALKGMNVSWASDVDQNVLVDVNINANDDYFAAIDNLLRQVDYYHEIQGSTIVVKYKETRQFHIAMPFIKQTYKTKAGGDMLGGGGGSDRATNVAGEISLMSEGVAVNQHKDGSLGGIEFNTWSSIENNLNSILNIWTTEIVNQDTINSSEEISGSSKLNAKGKSQTSTVGPSGKYSSSSSGSVSGTESSEDRSNAKDLATSATLRKSKSGNSYFIDKPVGLITVTAPRPLLTKLDDYFKALQKELYKQVAIEAKILEVTLDDSSSIGLNWNTILSNLSMAGATLSGGKTYSKTKTDGTNQSYNLTDTHNEEHQTDDSSTNTTGRSKTYNYLTPNPLTGDPLLTDTGSSSSITGPSEKGDKNSTIDIIQDLTTAVATSGTSAATVISNGLTGSLGGTISLAAFTFDSFLNAVSKQGKATILSNPKLSVLNGQPALLTVGKNVTYIDNIEVNVSDSGVITYSAETARALSGIGLALTANIIDDNQIILNLVPVTSELSEPIEYRAVGLGSVGLPIINVREMSTTVKVKNGEMLVIGGLISSVAENEGTFLPGTSNLSFFKYLFGAETKNARKRELIILLKPRII